MITNKINKTKINTKLVPQPQVGVLVTVWHPQPHWLFINLPPFLPYTMMKKQKSS